MQTHFLELQLPFVATPTPSEIEAALSQWGQPLRWAITKVVDNCYHLEAIVTRHE
jgi:hypothetical protein